ncbi:MAG: hypothetical protein HFH68_12200 [Lachnospiraceae bacterium]|nr:hypothetical protein [Lachnospiraceae bacterium]
MQDSSFSVIIKKILSEGSFLYSDIYFTRKILKLPEQAEITRQDRQDAYVEFRKKTNCQDFASVPTIKRWFGINGYSVPGREQVYQLSFALGFSVNETEEILKYGLHEPGISFNDYHEVIYVYCLENKMKWQDAKNMECQFENLFDGMTEFIHTCNTKQLMQQYMCNKNNTTEEFMEWMSLNIASFKGYSKTTLDYLNKYSSIIINYIRMDASENLESLLQETDFALWEKNKIFYSKDRQELIQKYIRKAKRGKQNKISEGLLNNILELNRIANSKISSNQSILSEIFMLSSHSSILGNLTGKHLSDLLNLPLQLERAMRADKAASEMEKLKEETPCPVWIKDFIYNYTKGKVKPTTVKEASAWIGHFCTEHKRRCKMVQRKDLLPMVLYVSQRKYLDTISGNMIYYNKEQAQKYFVEMANATLSSCGMAALTPAFQLDALLLACFQPNEMYSYSDILDALSV